MRDFLWVIAGTSVNEVGKRELSRAHRLRDILWVMAGVSVNEVGKRTLSHLGLGKLVDRGTEDSGQQRDLAQLGDLGVIPGDLG